MGTYIGRYIIFNTERKLCPVCEDNKNKKCRVMTYYATNEYGVDNCMNCRISPNNIVNVLIGDQIEGYNGA